MKKSRRHNRHDPRLAQIHRYYDPKEVEELYDVCRNTVGNWIISGLSYFELGGRRLFRGDELNAFHRRLNEQKKKPCELYEIYCVSCREKYSLIGRAVEVEHGRTDRVRLSLNCPEGSHRISGWKKGSVWREIQDHIDHSPSSKTPD